MKRIKGKLYMLMAVLILSLGMIPGACSAPGTITAHAAEKNSGQCLLLKRSIKMQSLLFLRKSLMTIRSF